MDDRRSPYSRIERRFLFGGFHEIPVVNPVPLTMESVGFYGSPGKKSGNNPGSYSYWNQRMICGKGEAPSDC